MERRPGGQLAKRPLHFIWILDCSGSMSVGGKIQALNSAIREAIPHMQGAARQNPEAETLVRAVRFSTGAQWHIAIPTPVAEFKWLDLVADGETCLGAALAIVAEELRIPPMTTRALPPVLVLVSDGQPTDDFANGLKKLMAAEWGKRAVRTAVAIGQDADYRVLQKFIGNDERRPLAASNLEALVDQIRWASTVALKEASGLIEGPDEGPEPSSPAAATIW